MVDPLRAARLTLIAALTLSAGISTPAATATAAIDAADAARYAIAVPAVRTLELTGFTRPRAELPLVAETAGRIEAVAADIGETIADDGTFARLDGTFIRLELAEIAVRLEQLRAQVAYDEREVERYRRLAQQNNAAASQLDTFEQTLRNNRHEFSQLAIQQQVLEERLRRTRIPAPAGWRVTARTVEPGQWVATGDRIGAAADFDTLTVPFALTPEQHAALTALATATEGIRLTLPDLDLEVAASIHRQNPGFDPETRKLAVELRLDDQIKPQRGGLRATLALPMTERSGAVLLPESAVRKSYDEYWVDPLDGEPVRVLVLGRENGEDGTWLRVSSPSLKPGDRVALKR
jgi:RND family efflux transporter MFP subunit